MAFPTTGILDSFDRANSATTIGSAWSALESGATKDRGISSNQAYDPDAVYSWIYWNAGTFGPDCECYMTVSAWIASADAFTLMLRLVSVTVDAYTFDGYDLKAYEFGTDYLQLERLDNSVSTLLGASVSATLAAGHKIGVQVVGSTLTAFQDSGSGWVEMFSRTDATYAAAGYVGFYSGAGTAWRVNDFGGGTVVATPLAPRMMSSLYR